MNKLSSVALSAALVVAGVGASVSAQARPYVAVVGPFGYAPDHCGPYCYEHGRYWHRGYGHYRFDRFRRDRWYHR
jgi:hypothetical protein